LKITLLFLGLTFFLTACNSTPDNCTKVALQQESEEGATISSECTPGAAPGDEVVEVPPILEPIEGDVPAVAGLFAANVSFTNFTSADVDKVQEALGLIQRIVRTKKFRDRVLRHSYQGSFQFVQNNGLSNEQIYKILLDGAETLKPEVNHIMDLQLELYTNNTTSTVGYTYPNTLKIWMNRKFFNRYNSAEVARNIFHEWTHKLGFGHDSNATARRPYSVPYGIGTIIQELALEL